MAALLLPDAEAAAAWLRTRLAAGAQLHTDSRALRPGDAFLAYPGHRQDGRRFVAAAFAAGAAACIVEAEGAGAFDFDARTAAVPALKRCAGDVAAAFYAHPGRALDIVAVTGTNGKTSTAFWTAQALEALGVPCGIIGTLGAGRAGRVQGTGLTTPDPVLLQRMLRGFVDDGLRACAMEASSIGLAEGRMQGVPVKVAVFTNLTQDHLDYHGTMQAYAAAKRKLFEWPGLEAAVVNADDAFGQELIGVLSRLRVKTIRYGIDTQASIELRAEAVEQLGDGLRITLASGAAHGMLQAPVIGAFNAENLLAVTGALLALGHPLAAAAQALAHIEAVPGRLERIALDGAPLAVVDYAHTPDALAKALAALRPVARSRGGRLWCVFGCGGDRDAGKRPLMGRAAEQHSDAVVLTSDNPRSEDPLAILRDIRHGFEREPLHIEPDRAAAIGWAIAQAQPQDVVLIAGKGHEDYQIIGARTLPFRDQQVAREALSRHAAAAAHGSAA
jgi:UDP-N-acetylmuramoyl-L-alanyl-D-glutamate--2,6-diaminopimelate ligase